MPQFKNLQGKRFGKWTVLNREPDIVSPAGTHYTAWLCRCDCGTVRTVRSSSLLNGKSVSCGCEQRRIASETMQKVATTHGESKTRLYGIWAGMKKRCQNPKATNYSDYGGRGICVYEEWEYYPAFRDWALLNGYDDEKSIDRIDNDGDYRPDNCRWATRKEQCNNRRSNVYWTYADETYTIAEWAEILNVSYDDIWATIKCLSILEEREKHINQT